MPDINPEERVLALDPLPPFLPFLRLYMNTEHFFFFKICYSDTELMYTITWSFYVSRLSIKFYVQS